MAFTKTNSTVQELAENYLNKQHAKKYFESLMNNKVNLGLALYYAGDSTLHS